jgi:hypothetical protein
MVEGGRKLGICPHLRIYGNKIEKKCPITSNLRLIQFYEFWVPGKKLEIFIFLEIKTHLNVSTG